MCAYALGVRIIYPFRVPRTSTVSVVGNPVILRRQSSSHRVDATVLTRAHTVFYFTFERIIFILCVRVQNIYTVLFGNLYDRRRPGEHIVGITRFIRRFYINNPSSGKSELEGGTCAMEGKENKTFLFFCTHIYPSRLFSPYKFVRVYI
jgi:hypothetical protein